MAALLADDGGALRSPAEIAASVKDDEPLAAPGGGLSKEAYVAQLQFPGARREDAPRADATERAGLLRWRRALGKAHKVSDAVDCGALLQQLQQEQQEPEHQHVIADLV